MTKILIVDDHPLVRAGFAQLIGDCPDLEVCAEAADMSEALKQVDATDPDLAIIDLSLAGGSGLDLIERIKSRNSKLLMLVASMHDETLYAERVLAAGARGYINKQEAQDRIIHAIRQVLGGKVYLSQNMTDRLLNGLVDTNNGRRDIDSLSNRELQVFELIGQGVSTSQMAGQLNLSTKTIETHQAHIKKKLGLGSAHELTQRAIRWVMDQKV
ncbi:MAG: response regulator transcription factor [Gammaproteobacteria bacterium]|nr:response regulator transcription factor [Gammaproteobacteria bacterium]MDH3537859.1 response regulator transcription factor [Gammaproteobacteria bacterium]